MYKKFTNLKHSKITNDLMSYIYDNIETNIDINQLANEFGINKFYLHKVFKKQTGMGIYETIKSIRLQKASNILITNKYSTITEISNMCGYSTQTSFIRAFKERFGQTPTYWRNGGFKEYSNMLLDNSHSSYTSKINFKDLKQGIVKVTPRMAYYRRHKGYNSSYKNIWEKMIAWIYTHDVTEYEKIGIYHDNPTITPLEECQYVACVVPKNQTIDSTNSSLPALEIQKCICVTFDIKGTNNDILMLIIWIYHEWLPDSGYEKITIPTYIVYDDCDILNHQGIVSGTLHVPVKAI
jgi:AraC family transcriptional regulator